MAKLHSQSLSKEARAEWERRTRWPERDDREAKDQFIAGYKTAAEPRDQRIKESITLGDLEAHWPVYGAVIGDVRSQRCDCGEIWSLHHLVVVAAASLLFEEEGK